MLIRVTRDYQRYLYDRFNLSELSLIDCRNRGRHSVYRFLASSPPFPPFFSFPFTRQRDNALMDTQRRKHR